jgi:hypothetical protein
MSERVARVGAFATLLGVGAFGLVAEWLAHGPLGYDPAETDAMPVWAIDLATGWLFLGCGVLAWLRRPASLVGPLLALTAFAWFLGTAAEPALYVGTTLAPSLVFLYRGPLYHLILTFPTGRTSDRVDILVIVIGYATCLLAPVWLAFESVVALSALLAATAYRSYRRAHGPARRDKRLAVASAVALGVAQALAPLVEAAGLGYPLSEAAFLVFHVILGGVALGLTIGLIRRSRSDLTDIVVELGQGRSTMRNELARVLGDPTLTIGYWSAASGAYIDDDGHAIDVPPPGSPRIGTSIERDGRPAALIVHDREAVSDPDLPRSLTRRAPSLSGCS